VMLLAVVVVLKTAGQPQPWSCFAVYRTGGCDIPRRTVQRAGPHRKDAVRAFFSLSGGLACR
jgi:hypothetical protein